MSISAVSGAAQAGQQIAKPRTTPTTNDVTPFGQQLDTQTAQAPSHHHHNRGAASQSAATAATSTASPASSSLASSLLQLLG